MLGNFRNKLLSANIFLKLSFSKNLFRITIRLSNSLDPDQARHFVAPDMGPNCLQRLSADDNWYHWQISFCMRGSFGSVF